MKKTEDLKSNSILNFIMNQELKEFVFWIMGFMAGILMASKLVDLGFISDNKIGGVFLGLSLAFLIAWISSKISQKL